MQLHGAPERVEGEALDLAVDGKGEIRAVLGRTDRLHVLDDLSKAILDHSPTAAPAAERVLERELEALLARVFHTGEADQVRRDFAGRVVAAVLALLVDARQPEPSDRFGRL